MAVGINDWLVKGTGIAQDAFIQLGITQDDLRETKSKSELIIMKKIKKLFDPNNILNQKKIF